MKKPTISFCILTWNRYKFLELCLENLIKSLDSPGEVEIIVMNNGSTDNTRDVLKKYEGKEGIRIVNKKTHTGLNAYKKLFAMARGTYVVDTDDDVLEFPKGLDKKFVEYMTTFKDYGFVALNVVQNEFTNGSKPDASAYTDDIRGNMVIQQGPTGGWCTCFRKKDYNKVRLPFALISLNFKRSEDGTLSNFFRKFLGLKSGIIKNEICFHASGPYYAKMYGHLDREIEKYKNSNLAGFVEHYKSYKE